MLYLKTNLEKGETLYMNRLNQNLHFRKGNSEKQTQIISLKDSLTWQPSSINSKFLCHVVLLLLITMNTVESTAQWSSNAAINNAVCTATGIQNNVVLTSDNAGGAIITWTDYRAGSTNRDIYAQRIDATGSNLWTADGIAICTATGNQQVPSIVSDGLGGAIISWQDYRVSTLNSDVYVQKIDASGAVQWASNGVALCTATGTQVNTQSISDGLGGAIVTWQDARLTGNSDIYAARIDGSGAVSWTLNGVLICGLTTIQSLPAIATDGAGGAIITWEDWRSGSQDIYARRINSSGVAQWTLHGIPICTASSSQVTPKIVEDGVGGAIISWSDDRISGDRNIFTQRVNSSGVIQWTSNGIAVTTAVNSQSLPVIISDNTGGAIITWQDGRVSASNTDIYAQRVSGSGSMQWTANGHPICTAPNLQSLPSIALSPNGEALISWHDTRSSASADVYTQKINLSGAILWAPNGIATSTATGVQQYTKVISDGQGGAMVVYEDSRSGQVDIYAQNILGNGTLGNPGISCIGALSANNDLGQCSAGFSEAQLLANVKPYGHPLPVVTFSPASPYPVGLTLVTATATNAAGTATCSFTISVSDTELPQITCPTNLTFNNPQGLCSISPSLGTPSISDNCPGSTFSNNAPGSFPIGLTQVTWNVLDASGNSATCMQSVTLADVPSVTPILHGLTAWQTVSLNSGPSAPSCGGDADDAFWFYFIAADKNDVIQAKDASSGFDAVIELFDACAGTSLGCFNNYGAGALESALPGNLVVGQKYYVRVYDSATGPSSSTSIEYQVKTFGQAYLRAFDCGSTDRSLNESVYSIRQSLLEIYSNPSIGVSGYGFRFINSSQGVDATIQRPQSDGFYMQLSNIPGLQYNSTYDVLVQHRIAINANGFTADYWSGFGPVCTVSLGDMPTTQLRSQYCQGTQDYALADQVLADAVITANQYRFTFTDGVNTYIKLKGNYALSLHEVSGLQYGKTYQVTVQARLGSTWTLPGIVCSLNMLAQPPSTSVRPQFCNGTYLFPHSNSIQAWQILGADQYQWRFTPVLGGPDLTQITNSLSLAFNQTSMPLQAGASYNVAVRAATLGIWGDYNVSCTINIAANPAMNSNSESASKSIQGSGGELKVYPNPSDGSQITVYLKAEHAIKGELFIEILDLQGRLVLTDRLNVKGDEFNTILDLNNRLSKGSYVLRILGAQEPFFEHLIIE